MANGSSRVTVVSPDRTVDLALPGSVPVGDLMAQLLQLCTDHHDRSLASAWTLCPVGGTELAWASTLASARVRDGSVLELTPRSMRALQTTIEDVRDATEDAVDHRVERWSARDTTTVSMLVLAALCLLLLVLPGLWVSSAGNGVPVAVATAGAVLWGAALVARNELMLAAHGLMAVGLAWTAGLVLAATGPLASSSDALPTALRTGLSGAAVLSAATVGTWAVPRLAAWAAAACVVFLAIAGWAAMDLVGRSAEEAIAVVCVLGILSLGVLPRVSLAAGGLAGLDYLVRTHGSVDLATVDAKFARSRAMLTGALVAAAALIAAGTVRLEVAGSSMQVALATAVGGCLLLRARAFSQFLHVLILVLAGLGALLGQLASDLFGPDPRPSTFAGLLLVAAGAAVLARGGASSRNDIAGARSRRLLDITESVMVATLMPLLAANLGVLDWVGGLVN